MSRTGICPDGDNGAGALDFAHLRCPALWAEGMTPKLMPVAPIIPPGAA
jgi:hypothetical protein